MEIEKRYSSLVRDEELMSAEELDAWEKALAERNNFGDDPLKLLGQNRDRNIEMKSEEKGPNDGDML